MKADDIMAKKKGEAKALRIAKRKQRRQLKKQAASAKHATVGARVKGLRAGGDQLCQGATLTTFNTTQLKAGEINLNHKPPSSCNEKDISNNLDSLNIRGGHHPLFGSFDSVTGNAHSAVDKCYDNLLFHDDFNTSCRRDQGDIRANWQNRQAEGPGEHAGPRRNLLDAYPDHLELQLNNIAVVTLSLAGQMAKQICLEAIFEFLQKVSEPGCAAVASNICQTVHFIVCSKMLTLHSVFPLPNATSSGLVLWARGVFQVTKP